MCKKKRILVVLVVWCRGAHVQSCPVNTQLPSSPTTTTTAASVAAVSIEEGVAVKVHPPLHRRCMEKKSRGVGRPMRVLPNSMACYHQSSKHHRRSGQGWCKQKNKRSHRRQGYERRHNSKSFQKNSNNKNNSKSKEKKRTKRKKNSLAKNTPCEVVKDLEKDMSAH